MMTGGRALPSAQHKFAYRGMSQTSIERLKDYLGQLPPQSQALLMREFERAIERGEDTTVATFVLEQLRKVVRGTEEEARPRTDDPARLLFRPLEPFLVEGNSHIRPGQVRRASLLPVWQWLIREGAPEQAREFEAALAKAREVISAAEGFGSLRLLRGVEAPDRYLLLVEWATLEDHTVGFRGSPAFAEWRSHIGPFFESQPEVDHYDPVAGLA